MRKVQKVRSFLYLCSKIVFNPRQYVPANNSSEWSFYYGDEADKTKFDVRKIFDEGSSDVLTRDDVKF